jgi:hypothetical protein
MPSPTQVENLNVELLDLLVKMASTFSKQHTLTLEDITPALSSLGPQAVIMANEPDQALMRLRSVQSCNNLAMEKALMVLDRQFRRLPIDPTSPWYESAAPQTAQTEEASD